MDQPARTPGRWRPVRVLVHVEEAFGALLLVAITVLVVLQVAGRYAIASPLVWTDEVARLGLVWLTFVGAAFVMSHGEHITVELFGKILGRTGVKVVEVVAMLVVLGTCLAFLPGTLEVAVDTHGVTSPALGFPRSLIYAAVLAGLALMALHAVLRVVEILTGRDAPTEEETTVDAV